MKPLIIIKVYCFFKGFWALWVLLSQGTCRPPRDPGMEEGEFSEAREDLAALEKAQT